MGLLSKFKSVFVKTDDSGKYTGIISAKEGKIVALESEIAALKAKNEQIALLQKELDNLRKATSKGDATIQAKEARIATLERTVTTLKEKLEATESKPKPKPEPKPAMALKPASKPELKYQPRRAEPVAIETPPPLPDNLEAKSSTQTNDPYQQLGQELVDAFRKTTRKGEDQSK